MRSKLISSFLVVAVLAVITACGGSNNGGGGTTTPPPVTVTAAASNPTVVPGGTDQFTATVTGTSSTTVAWSIGSSDAGSIDASSGLYTAPATVAAPATIHVTATLASDSTKTGSATATVVQLTGITVSPMGPTLAVNDTKTFTATGTFTDGSNSSTADWSDNVTWASSKGSVATISSSTGTATAIAVGVTTITATDSTGGTIKGKSALSVTAGTLGNGTLSGKYVFSVTHAGSRGQAFSAGVFVADGTTGQITGGVESFNGPQATASNVTISAGVGCGGTPTTDSCYTVNGDGRGTLHLTTSRGTDTFVFILSSDGSHGRLILSGTSGVEVGTFEKQTATTLGNASYSLLLGGMDGTLLNANGTQNSEVLAGQFTVSSGNVSAGATFDINDNGMINGSTTACGSTCPPVTTPLSFSATFTQPASNGRGTLTLNPTGIPTTQLVSGVSWHFDFFVVSANKIVLIQTDVQGTPTTTTPTIAALAGKVEKQTFATTAMNGQSFVFLVERSAAQGLFGSAGQWIFGAATITGEFDANCLQAAPTCQGTTVLTTITAGGTSYTVDSTGRGVVKISTSRSYVFYLIGSPTSGNARMYVLETDNKPNAGVGIRQSGITLPPTGTTLAFDLAQLATGGDDLSYLGQLNVDSATTLSGIADANLASEAPSSVEVDASSLVSPDASGRGTVTLNIPDDSTQYGFYLMSPTQMVIFGLNPLDGAQAVDGTVEVQ